MQIFTSELPTHSSERNRNLRGISNSYSLRCLRWRNTNYPDSMLAYFYCLQKSLATVAAFSDSHLLPLHYPCCSSDTLGSGPEVSLFHLCSSPGGSDSSTAQLALFTCDQVQPLIQHEENGFPVLHTCHPHAQPHYLQLEESGSQAKPEEMH